MNTVSKRASCVKRLKKVGEVTEALRASKYITVIAPFRDNERFRFIGHALIRLRRIENEIISDLTELDEEWSESDIDEAIVSHCLESCDIIDQMISILEEARDKAWNELDEIGAIRTSKAE